MADQITEASLKLGGDWATKEGSLLGFNDQNGNYKPIPFDFTRATTATRVNRDGLIEEVQSGVPRIDFLDNPDGALLLEPQRTNLITYSEDFSASWFASNITITSNAITSPEGVNNATLLANTSASNYLVYAASVSASTTYNFSFYAKNVNATAANFIFYDASNSAVISTTAYEGDLTTEWRRLDFSVTTPVGCTTLNINIANGLSGSLYVFGAQLEEGSYATSYIPTSGSAVTRLKSFSSDNDLVSTPISFGANDDFTFFYEGQFKDLSADLSMICGGGRYQLGDDYKNYLWVRPSEIWINGFAETSMATAPHSISDNTNTKILVRRSGSVITFFVDGVELTTTQNTPNTAFTFRSFGWSYTNAVYNAYGSAKQFIIFPTALTDEEAIELTT